MPENPGTLAVWMAVGGAITGTAIAVNKYLIPAIGRSLGRVPVTPKNGQAERIVAEFWNQRDALTTRCEEQARLIKSLRDEVHEANGKLTPLVLMNGRLADENAMLKAK